MEQRHRCVVHISITVVARYRSNLRDSEESNDIFSKDCRTLSNREIYTGVRHRAVRSRRVPSGFRAAADCSIKYTHTHLPHVLCQGCSKSQTNIIYLTEIVVRSAG